MPILDPPAHAAGALRAFPPLRATGSCVEFRADWRSIALQVNNQSCVVIGKIWVKFAQDRVHWARFAGRNFTHCQLVKRRTESWGRRFEAIPPSERLAVLAAIMAVVVAE
ncbi:MAG: hypothetical protein OXL68_13155 [Paracoccaceae bacterium]|nr:hypothetical protein [Paracoccaceae bacterium]